MNQYGRGGRGVRRVYETDYAEVLYAGLDLALRKLGGKKGQLGKSSIPKLSEAIKKFYGGMAAIMAIRMWR